MLYKPKKANRKPALTIRGLFLAFGVKNWQLENYPQPGNLSPDYLE
jgi:hypothetical protein